MPEEEVQEGGSERMQDGVQEEDTRGRRLRKDARRAAGKEQQKRRVGEDAGRGAEEDTRVGGSERIAKKNEMKERT